MWNPDINELGRKLAEDAHFDPMPVIRWFFGVMMAMMLGIIFVTIIASLL